MCLTHDRSRVFEPFGAISAHGGKSLLLAAFVVVTVELHSAVAGLDRDSPLGEGFLEALLHRQLEPTSLFSEVFYLILCGIVVLRSDDFPGRAGSQVGFVFSVRTGRSRRPPKQKTQKPIQTRASGAHNSARGSGIVPEASMVAHPPFDAWHCLAQRLPPYLRAHRPGLAFAQRRRPPPQLGQERGRLKTGTYP